MAMIHNGIGWSRFCRRVESRDRAGRGPVDQCPSRDVTTVVVMTEATVIAVKQGYDRSTGCEDMVEWNRWRVE